MSAARGIKAAAALLVLALLAGCGGSSEDVDETALPIVRPPSCPASGACV